MAWFVSQIRDNLGEMLTEAGFSEALAAVDTQAVADSAPTLRKMMEDCVPAGYVRSPGVGLRRAPA